MKAARQKRFGNLTLDNRPNKRQSSGLTPDELEAKKKQAERLGLPLKGTRLASEIESMGNALSQEEQERMKQRAARFGISSDTGLSAEEEERKRKRLERFAKK